MQSAGVEESNLSDRQRANWRVDRVQFVDTLGSLLSIREHATWIELQPFSEAEKEGSHGRFLEQWLNGTLKTEIPSTVPPQKSSLPGRVVVGGYPEACRRPPARARQWQEQYLRSIIERDIHDVSQIRDGEDVRRLLEYLSHQTAQLLNVAETAKALGHTRDKDKVEVDCVLTQGRKTWGVEIKAASSVAASDTRGLRRLAEQAGNDFHGGIVFYDGAATRPLDRDLNLYAVPISKLWEL
jgi:predicted AAA+ superfamily ATPase